MPLAPCCTHLLLLQKKPLAQFKSLEQVVGQALLEHTKGAHATVAQVPTSPGKLHACAVPPVQLLQLVLQQTPWAQLPLPHWPLEEQAEPFPSVL